MRWRTWATAVCAGFAPLALAATVVADTGSNAKLAPSQGTYYVTQVFTGQVARVVVAGDGSVRVTEGWISGLPTGGPDSAVFAADGSMIVSNFGDGTVSRVDVGTRQVLQKQVNSSKYSGSVADLATDPKRNAVYFILRGDSSRQAVGRLDLGTGATQDLNPDGVESVGGIAVSDDGSRLFVASGAGYVAELSPTSGHVLRKATVKGSPDGMSWDPASGALYAAGCGGICQLTTGGDTGSSLAYTKTLTGTDGDGIAADGQGHVYVAQGGCGSLCRLDVATNQAVTVADGISGADDVTPVAGAGSAAAGCRALVSCLGGAGGAGLAAAGIGLIAFMGAAGFTTMRPAPAHLAASAHGSAAGHPLAASGHATAAGVEASGGRLEEEAGDKLLDLSGAGLEVGAQGVAAEEVPAVPPEPPPVPQPPSLGTESQPPGLPGAARDARNRDGDEPDGPPPWPPPV